jgi:hypothetical protein
MKNIMTTITLYENSYTQSDARMRPYNTINCFVHSEIMNSILLCQKAGRFRSAVVNAPVLPSQLWRISSEYFSYSIHCTMCAGL